ncbi:hypothetical protein OS493_033010 [Desmophyllum pertusum]|uniref:Uncharacterized protein n=1 Tax=Desmophyllum pertusum TaxID=174260 RepID=A0A9X0D8V7_9CNID|nr:hypothetical protein OS493_033010 [Desmophyllum pertusum]
MFHNKTAQPPYTEPSSSYDARPSPNATNQSDRIYLPTPIDSNAKHCLFISMAVVAVLGFVGNVLVSYHVSKKEKMLRLRGNINSTAFSRRLNYYIGSLVISDILCPAVTLPLFYLQLFTDVYQKDWHYEDNNPHEGRQEIEAGNADLNNGEEDKYNNFRDKTEQQRALSIEQYQVKESRRKPTFKGERHVAYKMEELQAAVVPKKKDACCQIVITVDVH